MNQDKLNIYIESPLIDQVIQIIGENTCSRVEENQLCDIAVTTRGISMNPDWDLQSIPFIYTQFIPFTSQNLQLVIDLKLEKYDELNSKMMPESTLFSRNFTCIQLILNEGILSEKVFDDYVSNSRFEEYAVEHNKAVILHYNSKLKEIELDEIVHQFKHAAYLAPDAIWMAYSNYLFMIYLLENNMLQEAIEIGFKTARRNIPNPIIVTTLITLYKVISQDTNAPIYSEAMKEIETNLPKLIDNDSILCDFYLTQSLSTESHNDLDQSVALLLKALNLVEKNNTNLQAEIHKYIGDLYLKMAQMGQSNKYIDAQKEYQEALKYFKKGSHPLFYAHCQMNLGIIYVELPAYESKMQVYAGLSQTAFNEAMHIFNKYEQPYQYAALNTNIANAMMRLLPEIDQDRFEKIANYLHEALKIRTAEDMPEERAITLSSMLNLFFHRIEFAEEFHPEWFKEIETMAVEIKQLSTNPFLNQSADDALQFVSKNASQA